MPNSEGSAPAYPEVEPLTEVLRGAEVESRHRGAIAVVNSAGTLLFAAGDPSFRTFWRSASKPLQALPALLSGAADGYGLEPRHLAIMCGSHTGKEYHVRAVREILLRADIPETALRCDAPGRPAAPHGCSGKHAAMLLTAKYLGEPLDDYTEIDHPVQCRIRHVLAMLGDTPPAEIAAASDGCSVPTFAMAIARMALAFARLVDPAGLQGAPTQSVNAPGMAEACARLVSAMQAHPEMLSGAEGDTRDITSALVRLKSPSLVAKTGAESLLCVGVLPGVLGERGVGIAVRAEDGGSVHRSCYLATVEALRQLGAVSGDDVQALGPFLGREVTNVHGRVVGGARPCFRLRPDARHDE